MAFSYNRLWKLLIDRGMTRTEMRRAVGISTCTLTRLSKGEDVTTTILKRICDTLNCRLEDIVEYTPSGGAAKKGGAA